MSHDDLTACRRMRASLARIVKLDPEGVPVRLAELDREIARLKQLPGAGPRHPAGERKPLEVIPIGARVKEA